MYDLSIRRADEDSPQARLTLPLEAFIRAFGRAELGSGHGARSGASMVRSLMPIKIGSVGWRCGTATNQKLTLTANTIRSSRVLLLATCPTISSCEDFDDIVAWGENHLDFLRRFSGFHLALSAACVKSLSTARPL
jgi:hypothetical protein